MKCKCDRKIKVPILLLEYIHAIILSSNNLLYSNTIHKLTKYNKVVECVLVYGTLCLYYYTLK